MTPIQRSIMADLEDIRRRFDDALFNLMPRDRHCLLILGEWPHSADLEAAIIGWLAGAMEGQKECPPNLEETLRDGDGMALVQAEHLLDDHWWVTVEVTGFTGPRHPEEGGGPEPAVAIARIEGSADRLPYTEADSGHVT